MIARKVSTGIDARCSTRSDSLPMISFGGSSLLVTLVSLGILLNLSEHAG